jgi:hypothetical protein
MSIFDRIAEEKIQAAMQTGQFNGLAGTGQPLDLRENPFEAAHERLANQVLKNADILPAWLEDRRAIEADLEKLRQAYSSSNLDRFQFHLQIETLNRRILAYNLSAPAAGLHLPLLDEEKEALAAYRK